jgi:hypothetical protein
MNFFNRSFPVIWIFVSLFTGFECLVIYCKPEIRIARNPREAEYVCQGGGIPPKGKFQRINVIPQSEDALNAVTDFKVVDKSLYFVPNIIFDSFRNMRNVVLSNVQIEDIDKNHFRNANALKHLSIQVNNIPKLKARLFELAPNIVTLRLPNNNIYYVHKDAFHGLHQIQEIGLENNKIQVMSAGTFGSLNSLSEIKLLHNYCIDKNFGNSREVENAIPNTSCGAFYRKYSED